MDDERVEVDQSVFMLQCWNLYVCTYVQLINQSDIQRVTTPHDCMRGCGTLLLKPSLVPRTGYKGMRGGERTWDQATAEPNVENQILINSSVHL